LKIHKPNTYTHNVSELFIYGGLAVIIVPVINLQATIILLVVVSIYDIIAVFYTKHMIKIAKFQSKAKLFAGLFLPYKTKKAKKKNKKVNIAILGGGDMAFPLIFAGVAMKTFGFLKTNIIPLFAAAGLITLFLIAKKKKFYPAMPFITAGCFLGYFILTLI
jgi:presenilin-like A22 family membrane protease